MLSLRGGNGSVAIQNQKDEHDPMSCRVNGRRKAAYQTENQDHCTTKRVCHSYTSRCKRGNLWIHNGDGRMDNVETSKSKSARDR